MKIFISFVVLLIVVVNSFKVVAQVAVSNDMNRRLFLGVENPMTIMIDGCPCSSIRVEVDKGHIKQGGPCMYLYNADSLGTVTFSVYSTKKSRSRKTPLQYKVYNIPDRDAIIGKNDGGEVKKDFLLNEQRVSYFFGNGMLTCEGLTWKVQSFTFLILRGNNTIFAENNTTQFFTRTEKDAMEGLQKGDKVLIINIIGAFNSKTLNLKPLEFSIID
jgi:hypothetical protein